MLELKNISRSFGGICAVDNCSFSVEGNTITSIIGPNGAGKTTAFNIISGITRADSGAVKFLDANITDLAPYKIARYGISRTFQIAKIFKNMTVRENLLIAKNTGDLEMKTALDSVFFPKSLDTVASELSYGQMRLLEIARALLMPHSLLMLDEPTAGVNPKIRHELRQILLNLKKEGRTVLLIEHDMDFVMDISDKVIVLNEGKVLTTGTPKEILADERVLKVYLGK